jgi:hypothetical protein
LLSTDDDNLSRSYRGQNAGIQSILMGFNDKYLEGKEIEGGNNA